MCRHFYCNYCGILTFVTFFSVLPCHSYHPYGITVLFLFSALMRPVVTRGITTFSITMSFSVSCFSWMKFWVYSLSSLSLANFNMTIAILCFDMDLKAVGFNFLQFIELRRYWILLLTATENHLPWYCL